MTPVKPLFARPGELRLPPLALAKNSRHFIAFKDLLGAGPPPVPARPQREFLTAPSPLLQHSEPEAGRERRPCSVPVLDEAPPGPALNPESPLDPMLVVLALPSSPPAALVSEVTPRADFALAVEELVRRISWGGDRRSGTARIEFGAGGLEGGSIVVHALGRQIQVDLDLPAGFDGRALEQRLRERLEARGLEVTAFTAR
jgi:hypothetical protein